MISYANPLVQGSRSTAPKKKESSTDGELSTIELLSVGIIANNSIAGTTERRNRILELLNMAEDADFLASFEAVGQTIKLLLITECLTSGRIGCRYAHDMQVNGNNPCSPLGQTTPNVQAAPNGKYLD